MKKVILFAASLACFVACGTMAEEPAQQPNQPQARIARLVSTAKTIKVVTPEEIKTAPLLADLKVSETKITYFYVPTRAVQAEGDANCVNTAIREALKANGDYDVLIGMETQVKYDGTYYNGRAVVESVVVSGYPARYINFRHPQNDYWMKGEYLLPAIAVTPAPAPKEDKGLYRLDIGDAAAGGIAELKLPFSFKKEK